MRTATELLAELLAVHEDPEQDRADVSIWLHRHRAEVRAVIEGGHVRETDDSDIDRAHWAIQRGIAKLRVTEFYTYSVKFEQYGTYFSTLHAAIDCMSVYAASHGIDRAREKVIEGEADVSAED